MKLVPQSLTITLGTPTLANKSSKTSQTALAVLTPVPVVTSVLPSRRVDQDKLAHLDVSERAQLCQLLDEFADCFVDKPGLCDVVTPRIQNTPEVVPRQVRPCRVPTVSKEEGDRQIADLLSIRLVRRSETDSPMTIPIVCVVKKDGGVRITCDFCCRNSFTESALSAGCKYCQVSSGIMLISSSTACRRPQVFLLFRKLKSNSKDWL